ncbi:MULTISPECIES: hypothetical protein [unclassified Streptomyces]|uniref:hypothetical protein n=1 Tax=unclassified Streptomyces TaxID=2593676 RepID=UPI00081D3A9E|nr:MULTISPECIES: hypothetical protein [unclassified Streptomyces]MYR30564.1 hypothetical protein [Streptomyces sp. SID4945]SCF50141.1 hypothetical protein GA0115257_12413 [Streptomyces sp. LcepLS]
MSIHIPHLTGPGRHRSADAVSRLRAEVAALEARAAEQESYIVVLDADVARADMQRRSAETAREAAEERERVTAQHLAQAEQFIRQQREQIAELTYRLEVGVRAETIVAQTQPIPTLTTRFEKPPVLRLGASPLAAVTNPGQPVGDADDTVEIPVANLREAA